MRKDGSTNKKSKKGFSAFEDLNLFTQNFHNPVVEEATQYGNLKFVDVSFHECIKLIIKNCVWMTSIQKKFRSRYEKRFKTQNF